MERSENCYIRLETLARESGVGAVTKKPPSLEVCIVAEDGDVIVQIFDSMTQANCTLTVRNPITEEKATITMNDWQAGALAELLQRVPAEDD